MQADILGEDSVTIRVGQKAHRVPRLAARSHESELTRVVIYKFTSSSDPGPERLQDLLCLIQWSFH